MSKDPLYDILQRITSVESQVSFISAGVDDSKKKIETLVTDVTAAKATFNTLKWVVGIVGTVLVLIWSFLAGIITLAIKHYLHW